MKKYKGFISPSKVIENALLKLSILGLLSLVIVQFSLSSHSIKSIIQPNNNEVTAIRESSLYAARGTVEIEIENYRQYEDLMFLRNGEEIQNQIINNNIIELEVYDGDVIELDATKYNESIKIKIVNTSENVEVPSKEELFVSDNNIVYLFKTKITQ